MSGCRSAAPVHSSTVAGRRRLAIAIVALVVLTLVMPADVSAHNVSKRDAAFVGSNTGRAIVPFLYLGAKHMVTGYDHLLFLVGVTGHPGRARRGEPSVLAESVEMLARNTQPLPDTCHGVTFSRSQPCQMIRAASPIPNASA